MAEKIMVFRKVVVQLFQTVVDFCFNLSSLFMLI